MTLRHRINIVMAMLFGGSVAWSAAYAVYDADKVPILEQKQAVLETHVIPKLQSLIPKDIGSKKTERPSAEPDCVSVHPPAQ